MTSNSVLHRAHNDSNDLAFVLCSLTVVLSVFEHQQDLVFTMHGFLCWPRSTQVSMMETDSNTATASSNKTKCSTCV